MWIELVIISQVRCSWWNVAYWLLLVVLSSSSGDVDSPTRQLLNEHANADVLGAAGGVSRSWNNVELHPYLTTVHLTTADRTASVGVNSRQLTVSTSVSTQTDHHYGRQWLLRSVYCCVTKLLMLNYVVIVVMCRVSCRRCLLRKWQWNYA